MNYAKIADLHRQLANEFGSVTPPPPAPPPAPTPPPTTGRYQVLISFYEKDHGWIGETVDVSLNGQWFRFWGKGQNDGGWTQKLYGQRGVIVHLNEPLTRVEFDPNQIKRAGAINEGFGLFNYKIGSAPSDQDLNNIVASPSDHRDWWATWHKDFAVQLYRTGQNGQTFDNPNFYTYSPPSDWSETGKYKLLINRWDGQ